MIHKVITFNPQGQAGPPPILTTPAHPVGTITRPIRRIIRDMHTTLDKAPGVGLAAPQIGVSLRIIVIHFEQYRIALINPALHTSGPKVLGVESCLSMPGFEGTVPRPAFAACTAQTEAGSAIAIRDATSLMARILQHEVDHLDGILYIHRMLPDDRLIRLP